MTHPFWRGAPCSIAQKRAALVLPRHGSSFMVSAKERRRPSVGRRWRATRLSSWTRWRARSPPPRNCYSALARARISRSAVGESSRKKGLPAPDRKQGRAPLEAGWPNASARKACRGIHVEREWGGRLDHLDYERVARCPGASVPLNDPPQIFQTLSRCTKS
jgi:hypothetical protein